MTIEEDEDVEIQLERPSRLKRFQRSIAARARRHQATAIRLIHQFKQERETSRLNQAKKTLRKQKKLSRNKLLTPNSK